jgi:hypothetical protein
MDESDGLLYVRSLSVLGESRQQIARAASAGRAHRVARGVYLDADTWQDLGARERYLKRVVGVVNTRRSRPVLSFWSAAAVHGLPIVGSWPELVHVSVGRRSGGRSSGQVVRHVVPLDDGDVVEVDGMLVTSVARTVIDMAAAGPVMTAVACADRALHVHRFEREAPLTTLDELQARFQAAMPIRAHARVRRVIEFATPHAESVLESVSRVSMMTIGVPRPVLQQRFDDHRGLIGWSEFYWPEFRVVGEADGRAKYHDARLRGGRSLDQVLYDEKVRADRLRAIPLRVSRWDWETALRPEALRRHLVAEGLPTGGRW